MRRLRDTLARFDGHRATQYAAGGGPLSGVTRGKWEEALQQVKEARDILRRYGAPDGQRVHAHSVDEARRALAHAADQVDAALDVAGHIDVTRTNLVRRADDIADRAESVGAADVAATAKELSRVLISDPLGGGHQRALRTTELDLAIAEVSARLGECRSAAAEATKLVQRATKGIDGFASPPLPDLDAPARSLTQLRAAAAAAAATATNDEDADALRHRVERLTDELAEALARIRAVVKAAGEVLDRRDDLRGWLRALTRRATVLGVATEPHVDRALEQLDARLWSAGCDLDEAERLLVRLTRMLDREETPDA